MRRAGGRLRRRRHVRGGHRRSSRPQCPDRREGTLFRRHHRALRRMALDSRNVAGAPMGDRRKSGSSAQLSAARGRQQLRRGAGRCLSECRTGSRRLLYLADRLAFRHAPGVSRLSRGSTRWRAGRPLDGDAAVRWTRARPACQKSRRGAAGIDGVRHDAGIGQGDRPLHAGDQIADLGDLRRQATVPAFHGRHALRPRHDTHERQCAGRTPCEIRVRSEDTVVAVVPRPRIDC